MRRKQKTEQLMPDFTQGDNSGCRAEDRVEPEETQGAQSDIRLETGNGDSASGGNSERSLLEAILDANNMFEAQGRVITNRGSAGIGGMAVGELNEYLVKHYRELCESICGGWHKPKPG